MKNKHTYLLKAPVVLAPRLFPTRSPLPLIHTHTNAHTGCVTIKSPRRETRLSCTKESLDSTGSKMQAENQEVKNHKRQFLLVCVCVCLCECVSYLPVQLPTNLMLVVGPLLCTHAQTCTHNFVCSPTQTKHWTRSDSSSVLATLNFSFTLVHFRLGGVGSIEEYQAVFPVGY